MTATASHDTPREAPDQWRMLGLLCLAVLLGMSLWFAGSAAAPLLQAQWALSSAQVAFVTTAVQLGFVAGTAVVALLNLADTIPSRRLFATAAAAGAVTNLGLAYAPDFAAVLASRFIAGACLAGVYPPAMKMAATWFRRRRGLAVGAVVGALTVGKAGPYVLAAVPSMDVRAITALSSLSALVASVLVLVAYRDGPFAFPARPFSWSRIVEVSSARSWRLALGGYLGHMAELYSYWTWIPAFLAASVAGDGHALTAPASPAVKLLGAAVIAVGGLGCLWGGVVADRIGRRALTMRALAVSGSCCLVVGALFGASLWLVAPLALVWGFFIIADSAQFSVMVAESVPAHAVGTAITLQVSLGFLLTTATIQVVPPVVRMFGWPWVFVLLAAGPLLGIASLARLRDVR